MSVAHKGNGIRAPSTWMCCAPTFKLVSAPFAVPRRRRPPVPVGVYADVLLFRGSEGPQVAELQRQLGVTVDGDFGPETEAAVRDFQRRTPGLKVDGIVGPATAAALRLKVLSPSQLLLAADNDAV